jgi:hypothetical protein
VPARFAPIGVARESRIHEGFSTDESVSDVACRVVARGPSKGTGNCLSFVKTGARGLRNSWA